MATVTGATQGAMGRITDLTGDRVTWADSPYIVTLKASDKRARALRAGNKSEAANHGGNSAELDGRLSGLK